jgi:hypothetical protein
MMHYSIILPSFTEIGIMRSRFFNSGASHSSIVGTTHNDNPARHRPVSELETDSRRTVSHTTSPENISPRKKIPENISRKKD